MNREPVLIAEPLVNVLRDIEAAFCRAHGLPLNVEPGEDEETDPAPCGNRSRDPPT